MRVLVVDDDVSARELLSRELRGVATDGVDEAADLADCFSAIEATAYDCVVLDLSLPDGWGLDTLLQVRRRTADVPIVVVSGTQGEQFAAKARRSGAAGFVRKGTLSAGVVSEAVLEAVRAARSGDVASDPISELATVGAARTPITAELFGQAELIDVIPDQFEALVDQYSDLLDLALDQTAFAGRSSASDHLRDLAYSLGAVGAGPRDVVRLHAEALEKESERRQGSGAATFMHEARLVVLELMGYLVSYYRLQAIGRGTADGESD